mgnify:FL=1
MDVAGGDCSCRGSAVSAEDEQQVEQELTEDHCDTQSRQ